MPAFGEPFADQARSDFWGAWGRNIQAGTKPELSGHSGICICQICRCCFRGVLDWIGKGGYKMLASFRQVPADSLSVVRWRFSWVRIALGVVLLAPFLAFSTPGAGLAYPHRAAIDNDGHFISVRECSQRQGPFVTQSTAWQRWRAARDRGYAVSNGVVPCDGGYCFYVYYQC